MTIEKGKFWALIPARGGSKGVPGKNIRNLGGYPLIAYTIAVCKQSDLISRIIVSTDDEDIARTACDFGAEVPFYRPKELASDSSADYGFVNHAIDWFADNEGSVAEFLVHMRPTTPLRDYRLVDEALKSFFEAERFTSLRSAHEAPESPYKWFVSNSNGTFGSISGNINNEEANGGRVGFPTVYIPDGYVDIIKTEYVKKEGLLHGKMMMSYVSPACIEVDTIDEFEMLEYFVNKKDYPIYRFLRENYKAEGR